VSPIAALEHTVVALAIALIAAVAMEKAGVVRAVPTLIALASSASIAVLIMLIANHITFPFHLDLMEGVVMQHARRAAAGESIYPLPTPRFVPLAYNALFYILAAPFLRVFGDSMPVLRLVSVLGLLGSIVATYVIVRDRTRFAWDSIAAGLFAASYGAMDAYLDTAHSDSWLICCALWGTYLVGRESRGSRFGGVLVLIAGFWFKQHGAVFLGAALVYLAWREGIVRSLPYWLLALVLGPVLYVWAPGSILGPGFHLFTWHVPSGWSQFSAHTIPRVVLYVVEFYPVLALLAVAGIVRALKTRAVGLLELELAAAACTAFMGSLDPGSSFNVFIPLAAFTIVYGVIELARISTEVPLWKGVRPAYVLTLLAFATVLQDPRAFWLPANSRAQYADLQATIRALPGKVYAPGIGELVDGPQLYPTAHWVALDDMMRGPHRTAEDSALARRMLDPIRHPETTVYVLTNHPLATLAQPVSELASSYTLVKNYGDRFASLAALPRRFDHGYPRYLYSSAAAGEVTHVP
jgi:hypothetical protein